MIFNRFPHFELPEGLSIQLFISSLANPKSFDILSSVARIMIPICRQWEVVKLVNVERYWLKKNNED